MQLFFFFFFFGQALGMQKLVPGSNLSHHSDHAGSLTHWANRELQKCIYFSHAYSGVLTGQAFFFFNIFFFLFTPVPEAYGSSLARGPTSCSWGLGHRNTRSELHLQPTPATACHNTGSSTQWARPGIRPTSSQILWWAFNPLSHSGNSGTSIFYSISLGGGQDAAGSAAEEVKSVDFWEQSHKNNSCEKVTPHF